ncbi:uncharacterized protein HMPREF1541_10727 [Cyphellophora europaea CBS 101466]|uniref:Rab-GAP TBC domain-containing protein n=1 Tax=Cyphellophora europaea (strain CBS 101466) TaxID=1220924 RepID=W2S648_CYPE1|nr:uncharacterized protein HMPREF1541_10727 [Cyphellophora europaea CBS 101466]ETN44177.1 hypothetical protein HMPREF1541_10727 [Cyphellophora europaea CBS 101466]
MDAEPKTATFRQSLHGLPYAETAPAPLPIYVTTSGSPQLVSSPPATGARSPASTNTLNLTEQCRTHDGDTLQPGNGSVRNSKTSLNSPTSISSTPSVPQIKVAEDERAPTSKSWLALNIPSSSFGEDLSEDHIKFSKRGSMLVDGRKVSPSRQKPPGLKSIEDEPEHGSIQQEPRQSPTQSQSQSQHRPSAKVLSTDEEMLSEKVRLFYAHGSEVPYDSDAQSQVANKIGLRWQDALGGTTTEASSVASLSRGNSATDIHSDIASERNGSRVSSMQRDVLREDNELAGGIEDWNDVDNADVDRYGFIVPKPDPPSAEGLTRTPTTKGLTRVTTSLQIASEAPRRKHTIRRTPSTTRSMRSVRTISGSNMLPSSPSQQSIKQRPSSSHSAYKTISRHSTFRSRDRKLMDDAGDMLTLPRSASNHLDAKDPNATANDDPRARRKEVEREEKWRKMARPISTSTVGGGQSFTFDTTSSKLIERTWKGIPDKWRATAWHAFLSASAKKRAASLTDSQLITLFNDYQSAGSPDDVQIDIDVPRTISSHIMFRRRYRGGQRLLFRVLHAMSLQFPETGYVQGMAALAATLLSYYSEEMAFVMLVRLWELRGLEKLYKHGFGGLMEALADFENKWLGQGEVAKKLVDTGIPPTAYGTRWYLTLFNYSIPFPAQLRVWDVFMLLGDDTSQASEPAKPTSASKAAADAPNGDSAANEEKENFGTTLDVLHATSAALIDGMRDILLESDFEGAMKVLTSWVPIKDEDLFMRVARAEWKVQRRKVEKGP